ncbi:MAG: beta-ketoacyl-[acyl-carrier-protein] synthase family protein [Phycisphaerales bacterium]
MTSAGRKPDGARVVITGMGMVTPLGHSVPEVWGRLCKGESGAGAIRRFDASTFKTDFAAEVKDYDFTKFVRDRTIHADAGYNARFALGAAAQAFAQAGLDRAKVNRRRFGLYLGSGEGTLDFDNYAGAHVAGWDEGTRSLSGTAWAKAAYKMMTPARETEQEANMTLSHVAWEFGCAGPASNCLTACAASTQAIGEAFEILRRGDADVMFAGGAHTMIHPLGVTGFIRLTALSSRRDEPTRASRPFDQTRDGFVMGEGAGMLVLETLDHARARGAAVLAEIAGYGSSADAFRITDMHPEGKGPQNAMLGALRQAGINPREPGEDGRPGIHYIAAHGTGTKENDRIETHAVKQVFGALAPKIPLSSVKSMMGHLIAAAGVTGVITSVQSIRTGWIVPTINYAHPDAALDLDYVPNTARDLNSAGGVHACLCNSYGFGGQNDCVIVRRAE